MERQIRSNWAQQAHDTQPALDTYSKEVLQRSRAAFITRLESDAELISAENADVPLRWRRLLEFYDHGETRIRATAQVVFADVVDSHPAQQELFELLSKVRDKWWLRLSPEDVDAHNESFMDPQAFLEMPCPVRRRMHAERALICLEERFGSQLVEYERNMLLAGHGEEESAGLWRIEMAKFLAAAALDNGRAHAENRYERLEEGFVRERDRAAVADAVLADLGVQLREEQAMVSEFQDTALGIQAQVDEFVEQCAESTENAETLAWHEENAATELCRSSRPGCRFLVAQAWRSSSRDNQSLLLWSPCLSTLGL